MPSLNINFFSYIQTDIRDYKVFVETGTYYGETILSVEPYFEKLYTIEYDEKLYTKVKNNYRGNKIKFILGDSSVVFKDLLPNINEKAIFFLDGHWSCGVTGRSTKDVPLLEEIKHINELFQEEAILIIDDFRLFGTNTDVDWSEISKEKIMNILMLRIEKLYHLGSECSPNDRLIIHLHKIRN